MRNDVKDLRTAAGLSQRELADVLDVSRQTVNSIEIGKYDPSLTVAFRLARVFECSIEDVFTPDPMPGRDARASVPGPGDRG